MPLTAHPSGKAQGFVHLRLAFQPLPADQAAAAARAEMAGAWAKKQGVLAHFSLAICLLVASTLHLPGR